MRRPSLMLIEWVDSSGWAGWRSIREARTHNVPVCVSVGWLLRESDTEIVICQSLAHHASDGDDETDDSADQTLVIPKVAVTKTVRLRKATGGKEQRDE